MFKPARWSVSKVPQCLVLAASISAYAGQAVSLMEVKTGLSVDPVRQEVVEPASTFAPDTPAIYVSARLADAPPGTTVKAVFKYLGEGEVDVADAQVTTEGSRFVSFNVARPDGGWPVGDYAVALHVDGRELARQAYAVAPLEGVRRIEDSQFGLGFDVPVAWQHRVSDDGDHLFEQATGPGSLPLTLRVQYIIKAATAEKSLTAQAELAESQLASSATVEKLFRETAAIAGQQAPYFIAAMRVGQSDASEPPHGYTLVLLEGVDHYYWISFDGPGRVYKESFPLFESVLSSIRIGEPSGF
jgi:hypothetical protein